MTGNKPSAPETLEELRAAIGELADEYEAWAGDIGTSHAARSCHRKSADHLRALLPPAPEPIKVGDRVTGRRVGRDTVYEVVAIPDGDRLHLWDEIDEFAAWGWAGNLTRVDSSPSPEPEPLCERVEGTRCADTDPCVDCDGQGRAAATPGVGVDGFDRCETCDPAPSPSPEVGEGAEPHESGDPEELAAAVAAGLVVEELGDDGWGPAFRWCEANFSMLRDRGRRFRIHGTVPGYGETGGA